MAFRHIAVFPSMHLTLFSTPHSHELLASEEVTEEAMDDAPPKAMLHLPYPKYRQEASTPVIKNHLYQPNTAVCAR